MRRLLPLLLALSLPLALAAQVEVEEIGTLQEAFGKAEAAFQAFQFPAAVEALAPVVETLSRWESAGRLTASDEALLQRTLELRGVAYFNLGKLEEARADFARLVQLRADYPFSRSRAPKVVRFFEEVRAQWTGTLALDISPPESQVFLDGRLLGSGGVRQVPVLKGLHTVRAVQSGFDPLEREVRVEVGTVVPFTARLVPNARTIFFFVQPQGTALSLDGKPVGTADRPAAVKPEWADYARSIGANPSAVYVISAQNLPPGEHRVTLSKPCHAPRTFLLNVVLDRERNLPGFVKTITLERKTVPLEVVSRPSGAEVLLDGQAVGTTPYRDGGFCIGDHDILVRKAGVGEYRARLSVPEGGPFRVEAALRPTLLWVGFTRGPEVASADLAEASSAADGLWGHLALFNGTFSEETDPLLPDTFFVEGVDPSVRASTAALLCRKYHCQGLVAGLMERAGEGGFRFSLKLLAPDLPGEDLFTVTARTAPEASEAFRLLDAPLLDFDLSEILAAGDGPSGPVLLRDLSSHGGPFPGDRILAIGETLATSAADLRSRLRGVREGEVHYLHDGKEAAARLSASAFRRVVAVGPYPVKRALLAQQGSLSAENPLERRAAALNRAFAEISLGRPQRALEALEGVSAEEPGEPGPSAVAYARAVALLHLGRTEEARPFLLSAAGDPAATLDGLGDLLAAPLAADLLRQLPAPPPAGRSGTVP
ncbi:MAG: PEGA domain-containing protein [Acidobacteriota bacterium]